MARITVTSTTWSSPVTLAADETWQCVEGQVLVTVEGSPATEDGVRLDLMGGVKIASGKDVRYRLFGGQSAKIAREAF